MTDSDLTLSAGKFEGARPSDIPLDELRFLVRRGSSALDRAVVQAHLRERRFRALRNRQMAEAKKRGSLGGFMPIAR